MPFDGVKNTALLNRSMLVSALRGKLPSNFEWDFVIPYEERQCGAAGCAIGVATILGILGLDNEDRSTMGLGRRIGFTEDQGVRLFSCAHDARGVVPTYGVPKGRVTPTMVADAIDALSR